MAVKMPAMPPPYASDSGSTLPPRCCACFVKKEIVIGINGYVQGMTSANRPAAIPARISCQSGF